MSAIVLNLEGWEVYFENDDYLKWDDSVITILNETHRVHSTICNMISKSHRRTWLTLR